MDGERMTPVSLAVTKPVGLDSRQRSMDFTDGLVVFAITLQLFWAVDPFAIELWRRPLTRHLPTILAVAATLLCIAGRLLFRPELRPTLGAVVRTYRGLILFAAFVIGGSLYARFALAIDSSFLLMGTSVILGGPVNLWLIRTSRAPMVVVRDITIAMVGVALLGVLMNTIHFGNMLYHAMEHVVLVAVAMPLIVGRKPVIRLLGALLCILAAVAPNKITGYIVLLMIFAWVFVDELMMRTAADANRLRAGLRRILGALVGMVGILGVVFLYQATKSHLPDGNTVYRLHTYQMAIDRFLDSWLWGRAFAASAVDHFDLFVVNASTQSLPTHSDPLDILANGGLLGAIPFVLGLLSMLYAAWKVLTRNWASGEPGHGLARGQLAMYFLVMTSGLTVMAFNPVLNSASSSYVYWLCSSLMCALVWSEKELEQSRRAAGSPTAGRGDEQGSVRADQTVR